MSFLHIGERLCEKCGVRDHYSAVTLSHLSIDGKSTLVCTECKEEILNPSTKEELFQTEYYHFIEHYLFSHKQILPIDQSLKPEELIHKELQLSQRKKMFYGLMMEYISLSDQVYDMKQNLSS